MSSSVEGGLQPWFGWPRARRGANGAPRMFSSQTGTDGRTSLSSLAAALACSFPSRRDATMQRAHQMHPPGAARRRAARRRRLIAAAALKAPRQLRRRLGCRAGSPGQGPLQFFVIRAPRPTTSRLTRRDVGARPLLLPRVRSARAAQLPHIERAVTQLLAAGRDGLQRVGGERPPPLRQGRLGHAASVRALGRKSRRRRR